jgi:hypothetical protein
VIMISWNTIEYPLCLSLFSIMVQLILTTLEIPAEYIYNRACTQPSIFYMKFISDYNWDQILTQITLDKPTKWVILVISSAVK